LLSAAGFDEQPPTTAFPERTDVTTAIAVNARLRATGIMCQR
jgi:hypothetical protein